MYKLSNKIIHLFGASLKNYVTITKNICRKYLSKITFYFVYRTFYKPEYFISIKTDSLQMNSYYQDSLLLELYQDSQCLGCEATKFRIRLLFLKLFMSCATAIQFNPVILLISSFRHVIVYLSFTAFLLSPTELSIVLSSW